MITVPYWWNGRQNSIEVTVYQYRPDLFDIKPIGDPIPHSPPSHWTQYYEKKQGDISQKFLLASKWNDQDDPTGWWMTEKYDGIRVYWDGGKLYTRTGKMIITPPSFTSGLPNIPMDAELW